MPARLSARGIAEELIGREILTPVHNQPNRVLEVGASNVLVATEASPEGKLVPLAKIQLGLDMLASQGEVQISPEAFDSRRSSFIGAVLAALPGVEAVGGPSLVRLATATPLRDGLIQACDLTGKARSSSRVSKEDPLHGLTVHEVPTLLGAVIADSPTYALAGSVGQATWAETPWVAIFNRLVTESAQRGHYLVALFHPDGSGFFLSLNQGITAVREEGGNYIERLREGAKRLQGFLSDDDVIELELGELDLTATTSRTRGYKAGNVVALWFSTDEMPHDAVIAGHLWRFLSLYTKTIAGENAVHVTDAWKLDGAVHTATEARRFGWHWRAEGRNSAVARKAKELGGYTCQGCGRNFVEEFGEIGKRCVDAHHLMPFRELDSRPRALNPETDFAVVCSNCHRLLHSEPEPLTLTRLSELLNGG
jgi:5-methylcytosine-specific restriction protein A